jgi:hypothetical protein
VLETFSISHGKASAYLPVVDLLRNYFDISATDDERKRREKVAGRIAILDRGLEDGVHSRPTVKVGQHSTGVDTESFTPHGAARSFSITHQGGK